ncbi:MAG TPA: hypothetical protein VFJ71_07745 [Candidatus Limnocylindrales bacterium]|nr:hypothetical protein [Candidatus Limnocylindrales bacterium]
MARAKRTARAEARRRYRASTDPAFVEADDPVEDPSPARPALSARPAPTASRGQERPSITGAFRSSFRPLDLRGDLRALPRLLMTKAFLIPAVVSGVSFILFAFEQNQLTAFLYQYFSYQFPVAAVFATGFFAPRASWLLGALVAILSTLFQFPLFIGTSAALLLAVLVQGAIYGSFFAAAAAWYRRFLNRANPNRMAAGPQSTTSRRPDGKIPKRNQQRPMLARRR